METSAARSGVCTASFMGGEYLPDRWARTASSTGWSMNRTATRSRRSGAVDDRKSAPERGDAEALHDDR
jgi:hypothetical protein